MGKPVLILGAGINGCALARELLLSGVSVTLVDAADIASGATSAASRLIHGGLRYLEFGEFDLVRESLTERTRLLRLAPQFVRPIELFIPTSNRFHGLLEAPVAFLRLRRGPFSGTVRDRGAYLVRAGLWLYDLYARDPTLPRHRKYDVHSPQAVPVNPQVFRWLYAYYDAQIVFPERYVLALLEDARRLAARSGAEFRVFTYHEVRRAGGRVDICRAGDSSFAASFEPGVIVNATGAWIDDTLARLQMPSSRLIGGTKGSHLFTFNVALRAALGGRGIYAEARDGRPVFITPLADTTLIGTTDLPFEGRPQDATASNDEIEYLLEAVNAVLPQVGLTRTDIDFCYSGVRPLPFVGTANPDAVTRRHKIEKTDGSDVPVYSLIGGKLTTSRSLAEEVARQVLVQLRLPVRTDSRQRVVPGGENYPADPAALRAVWEDLSRRFGLGPDSIEAVWQLFGTRTANVLEESSRDRPNGGPRPGAELLPGTALPCSVARWIVRHEWVRRLADLVERRLMLLYHQQLTVACLRRLAALMTDEGVLAADAQQVEVQATVERLAKHFGKRVSDT